MSSRFFFFVHSANQCRILAPVALRLQELGFECEFFNRLPGGIENPGPPLAQFGFECHDIARCASKVTARDVLITGNDKGAPAYNELIDRCLEMGCVYVGVVDGCRAERRYKRVPVVFGWGPSSIPRYPQQVVVVGSPAIEACWCEPPAFEQPPYAVINYKFTYSRNEGEFASNEARLRWLQAAVTACEAVGLAVRVSGHPGNVSDGLNVRFSREPFAKLIRGASLLISPVSTVVLQSIASGAPVVLVPAGDERLGEFTDPMGAFEIVRSADELNAAVVRAVANPAGFRAQSRRFFETHVSIDPNRPALERIVSALLELAENKAPQAAVDNQQAR